MGRAVRGADSRTEGTRLKFAQTPLGGAFVVEIERLEDERGLFGRSFCQDEFRARGVPWNDPAVGVDWPIADPILSERDRSHPPLP